MSNRSLGPINPYVVGQAIKGEYGFYGRNNLVEAVIRTLTTTQQSTIVLHGQRRIGKSSLLHRLRRDQTLKQAHLPVFFDLQLRQGFPLARILADLARTICEELELDIAPPDETELAADHHGFRRAFLPGVYRRLGDRRLVILFDEFDVVVPADVADIYPADTLLGYLQFLIEEDDRHLAMVFAVGQRLDLLAEGYRRLFKGTRTEPVGRLERQDTLALLIELGGQGGITYAHDALDEIWVLTNGHPYLTQLLGFEVFERLRSQQKDQVTTADVSACLTVAMEHGLGGLDWFWRSFGREEQMVLAAIAHLADRHKSTADVKVDATLHEHGLVLTEVDRRRAYGQLIQGDFLRDTGERRYQFAVEFIRLWILKDHPLKEVKNRLEQGNPEAQAFYRRGLEAYQRGQLNQAVKHYRQAIKHDPTFPGPQLALARAHFAQDEIQSAIEQYEKAYHLDPAGVREELIEKRLSHARVLSEAGDDQAAMDHAQRALQIDPRRPEARQLVSEIYLRQARAALEAFNLSQALEIVDHLTSQSPPILHDPGVGQCVRELWVNYSRTLTQRRPPNRDEAQRALCSLERVGLLDETATSLYNQIGLDKARDDLERDRLDQALDALERCLFSPKPQEEIRELLEGYSRQQTHHRRWSQAAAALEGLCRLVDQDSCRAALVQLYHEWGDSLLDADDFSGAMDVYRRGEDTADKAHFEQKLTQAWQRRAGWHLARHEFTQAEESYRQALTRPDAPAVRRQVWDELEAYFNSRREEGAWQRATGALAILEALDLGDILTLKTDLHLAQAQTELEQGRVDVAFRRLAGLDATANERVKAMILAHLRQKARNRQWAAGNAVLKKLVALSNADDESVHWRANWLYIWADALYANAKTETRCTRARCLCKQALRVTGSGEIPTIDLLVEQTTEGSDRSTDLRPRVCKLHADIALAQAEKCLAKGAMSQAEQLFDEALHLPFPPGLLGESILGRLRDFSEDQIRLEDWEAARGALDMARRLGIGHQEVDRALADLAFSQARHMFKTDQLETAFSILTRLKEDLDFTENERRRVKDMTYRFSRRYAGRARRNQARDTLDKLRDFLAPAGEAEMAGLLDNLNHEYHTLIKSKYLSLRQPPASDEEIDCLDQIVKAADAGFADALNLNTLLPGIRAPWLNRKIETRLALANAHLSRGRLQAALETYKEILRLGEASAEHEALIGQSLYLFSDRMLGQRKWKEARLALEELKQLKLPAPDRRTCPDPRVDGAIQRVLLEQARASLARDRIEETFTQLRQLPQPWPEAEVKDIIRDYSEARRESDDWHHSVEALQCLDQLLAADRNQIHEQQALGWLVDGLEKWGEYLEANGELEKAASVYHRALEYTRQAAHPRNFELAEHYIRVVLRQAQHLFDQDPLAAKPSDGLDRAIRGYRQILELAEHRPDHERQVNQAIYQHAGKLAEAGQWPRAYQVLDYLDALYPNPKDQDRMLFTAWRCDLALAEVRARLEESQLITAFERLDWLKTWLAERAVSKVGWADSHANIKGLVHEFCEGWLYAEAWDLGVESLERLARLIPHDTQITGWQVSALVRWGEAWSKRNAPGQAAQCFEKALTLAPEQHHIPAGEIEKRLLDARMAQAQQRLAGRDLRAAVAVYQQILQRSSYRSDLADQIRDGLKSHSDTFIKERPPDWVTARQALDALSSLKLDNSQVLEWRQALTLKEIKVKLEQEDLEAAFACLETLERPWPLAELKTILHDYCQVHAQPDGWPRAIEALKRLSAVLAEDASVRQWIIGELVSLGEILETRDSRGASEAFETAVSLY
jgi:tetratricopeptide (TPR) repeat protein